MNTTVTVSVIEFDFESMADRPIPAEKMCEALREGKYCWIDINAPDRKGAEDNLKSLGINEMAIKEALWHNKVGRYDRYDDCLHVTVNAPMIKEGVLSFPHVDLILGERFICSLHQGEVEFLQNATKDYQKFFPHAESLGFLLFQFWDHLIDNFRRVFALLEDDVGCMQTSIFGEVDDKSLDQVSGMVGTEICTVDVGDGKIFGQVSGLSRHLIVMRRNILGDTEVLDRMATERSAFISDTTQPFLKNMVGTLERLSGDLTVEREILEETLDLYLGIVSHRTNQVVNRLTIISLIFLPLTFLCGIYGMNFEHLPEFQWNFGYVYFWGLVVCIVSGLLVLMKIKRWL
jgi:magnesium transporter